MFSRSRGARSALYIAGGVMAFVLASSFSIRAQAASDASSFDPFSGGAVAGPSKVVKSEVVGVGDCQARTPHVPPLLKHVFVYVTDAYKRQGPASSPGSIRFAVVLSGRSTKPITVTVRTRDLSAEKGEDYVYKTQTLTFAAGQTQAYVTIPLVGEKNVEPAELFALDVVNVTNAGIVRGTGLGKIVSHNAP